VTNTTLFNQYVKTDDVRLRWRCFKPRRPQYAAYSSEIDNLTSPNIATAVVPFDRDGDTYLLGSPVHITIENLLGLDYVIQEPPKHVDYLPVNPDDPEDQWQWDVVSVGARPDFYVQLKDSKETTVSTKATDTTSWSIGASEEAGAKSTVTGGIGSLFKTQLSFGVQEKVGYDYEQHKSSYESEYHSREVSYTSQTNEDDHLEGRFQLMDIWRYRIYGYADDPAHPNGFWDIVMPGPKMTFSGGGRNNSDWYQPIHENRNILSYPIFSDPNLSFPGDLGSFKLPDGTEMPRTST